MVVESSKELSLNDPQLYNNKVKNLGAFLSQQKHDQLTYRSTSSINAQAIGAFNALQLDYFMDAISIGRPLGIACSGQLNQLPVRKCHSSSFQLIFAKKNSV